jgi:hypothetical protein
MPEENRRMFGYRVLRYTPNLVRDEWVNVGIVLEEVDGSQRRAKVIEEAAEIARVRRLHPDADEALMRRLPHEFEAQLGEQGESASLFLRQLDDTLSTVLQLSPRNAVRAADFDAELDRLYAKLVAPPARAGRGVAALEYTRAWIRTKLNDVFRRHRILAKLEKSVKAEEFTQPGDPLRLDYAYRANGARGFLHAVSLSRDPAQAKVLAYTAECIRARVVNSEFAAITEIPPQRENPRHQFVARLFDDQKIRIVPLSQIEVYAEELRPRLN